MPTKAIIAYGATVERSTDGGSSYDEIPEAKGVAVPNVEEDYVEVTSLDSPDRFREYIPGLRDGGVITIPCNYTREGYTQQRADQGKLIDYRITFPAREADGVGATGDIFEFQGYPTPAIQDASEPDAPMMMNVNIRTSGAITFTAGAAA